MSIITLVTDFGLDDSYVGEMKGAILARASTAQVVDLTHGVAHAAIREAAWVLRGAWPSFPEGTVHVAVVDPGVGGQRAGVAASAGGHFFVGPNNGILYGAVESAGGGPAREIQWRDVEGNRRGTTFDGRDVFAPCAARLALGESFAEVGPEVELEPMDSFDPVEIGDAFQVEIVRVDHFGNLISTLPEAVLRKRFGDEWRQIRVRTPAQIVEGIRIAYEEVERGELLLSIGSAGTLEISAREGRAADVLGLGIGSVVLVESNLST